MTFLLTFFLPHKRHSISQPSEMQEGQGKELLPMRLVPLLFVVHPSHLVQQEASKEEAAEERHLGLMKIGFMPRRGCSICSRSSRKVRFLRKV